MNCPRCAGVALEPVRAARDRLCLEACPRCRGMWFDAQELRASLGLPAHADPVPGHALSGRSAHCPACRVPLFEYCYPGTQVLVDACRQCGGAWLDRDEWGRIRQALRDDRRVVCPKCRASQGSDTVCERCGLIFAKYREIEAQREQALARKAGLIPELFAQARGFAVFQRRDWLDILSPLELANRYDVTILAGRNRFGVVRERSRSPFNLIGRYLLGHLRPAVMHYEDETGSHAFTLVKRFRLYFHLLEVRDVDDALLGSVRRRWHPFRDLHELRDRRGRVVCIVRGPILFLPFVTRTYRFVRGEAEVGRVTKSWRGLLREYFTDADVYRAEVAPSLPALDKLLCFGAVFLIDFGRFENNEGTD